MSRLRAFQSLGTVPVNVYWALSAISIDEMRVAIALLQDGFSGGGAAGSMTYTLRNFGEWYRGAGTSLLFKHLAISVANCGGIVHPIVAVRSQTAAGRERTVWFAREDLVMRIIELDAATGSFRLEQVPPPSMALAA
jgi:hypothetical protein